MMAGEDSLPASIDMPDCAEPYLDLLKKSLTHSLYQGADAISTRSTNPLKRWLFAQLLRRNIVAVRVIESQEEQRGIGTYWPLFGQTMIGRQRLDSLHACLDVILNEEIPGDVIEAGVWRGGATIFMRGLLKARGVTDRTVWVADSFQGLPEPRPDLYPADAGATFHTADYLAVSLDEVRENFRRYGLMDDQVRFLPGWFKDSLPTITDHEFALIRVDGDLYESTMNVLEALYPRLAPGGFLIVDDYSIESCRRAVGDYRRLHDIDDTIEEVDWTAILWRKGVTSPAPTATT